MGLDTIIYSMKWIIPFFKVFMIWFIWDIDMIWYDSTTNIVIMIWWYRMIRSLFGSASTVLESLPELHDSLSYPYQSERRAFKSSRRLQIPM
jgi:hypothetical protein